MRPDIRRFLGVFAIAAWTAAPAYAEQAARPYLDIPITQTVNRDGVIRYAVWVKVGERTVQAMLDTGSTGLRVLPSVLPRDVPGVPTDVAFGAGLHMEGLAAKIPIEIGSRRGVAPVEIVYRISCLRERPDCDVTRLAGDGYLIGGDGYPSEGYSAILGIGFQGSDIDNPLTSLHIKRWIVDLPRPFEGADGHLILDPDETVLGEFSLLRRHEPADAYGCIQGGTLPEKKCGSVLFDTGSPAITASFEGIETDSRWDDGTAGALTFMSSDRTFTLDFQAGKNGGLIGVGMTPPRSHADLEPFIIAGVYPYFSYDVLYDSVARAVGLKERKPLPATLQGKISDTASDQSGGP